MRHEDRAAGDLAPAHAAGLRKAHQLLHHRADVVHVQPAPVEGAVRDDGREHLADRRDAALARSVGRLNDEGGRAHPDKHAVAAPVERQRGFPDGGVGRRCSGGQEARPDPREQVVRRRVIGRDHQHAAGPPGADPVLGHPDRERRRRAGRVDLGVRAAGADQLGELGVPHRQALEQEPPVEAERVLRQLGAELVDAPVDLGDGRFVAAQPGAHGLQRREHLAMGAVLVVPVQVGGERVQAREGRREHDARVVAHGLGQGPPVGQLRADRRRAVLQHQRDARVAQRLEAGADREPGRLVEGGVALGLDAEVGDPVEDRVPCRKFDHVGDAVDRLERGVAGLPLDQAGDRHVGDPLTQPHRDVVDEVLAGQDPRDVHVVEHVLDAGQTEAGAGDDDRLVHRTLRVRSWRGCRGRCFRDDLSSLLKEVREQVTQLGVPVVRHGDALVLGWGVLASGGVLGSGTAGCGDRDFGSLGSARFDRGPAVAEPGRVQPAQRLVERRDVAQLGVVGEQHGDVVVHRAEHVLGEAVQGLLRPDLDEEARARRVQGAKAIDELHGRCDLPSQEVEHRLEAGVGRVEVAGYVRDDRQGRGVQVESSQRPAQRLAGWRDDRGVERMADRDADRGIALGLERGHCRLDGSRRAADDR